jgi:hypothetical protein
MSKYNKNPLYDITTLSFFLAGLHKTKVHVVAPLVFHGVLSRPKSRLLLNPCLHLPTYESKWVVLETRRYTCDITQEHVKLLFTWGTHMKHPYFRFCHAILSHWQVLLGLLP